MGGRTCDKPRFVKVYLFRKKDDKFEKHQEFMMMVEPQIGRKLGFMKFGNSGAMEVKFVRDDKIYVKQNNLLKIY